VWSYRDLLSWLYSDYRQLLWVKTERRVFSSFAPRRSDQLHREMYQTLENFIKVFGRGRVFILDYLGAMSSHDILNAMLVAGSLPELGQPINTKDRQGLKQEEVVLRQLWTLFEEHLLVQYNCTLLWPADPLALLVDKPDIILKEYAIPTTCLDLGVLRNLSLTVDRDFRKRFRELICFGRPDLVHSTIINFPPICELDLQAVTEHSAVWQTQFGKQQSILPAGMCAPGRLHKVEWTAHG